MRLVLALLILLRPAPAAPLSATWGPPTWSDGSPLASADASRVVVRVYRTTNPTKAPTVVSSKPGADNVTLPLPTRGTWYYYRAAACIDCTCSDNTVWIGYIRLTGPLPERYQIVPY